MKLHLKWSSTEEGAMLQKEVFEDNTSHSRTLVITKTVFSASIGTLGVDEFAKKTPEFIHTFRSKLVT